MAKPPFQREGGRNIEALNQTSLNQHRSAEEERRAILEQVLDKQITAESTQRAIFDQALHTQLQAAAARRAIIDRALRNIHSIEARKAKETGHGEGSTGNEA